MDFSLNEEQRLLADSVERFVRGSYPIETRRGIVHGQDSFSPDIWRQFADLGWLMLPFDEADGGLGGSLVETLVVMEGFGRGLVVEPYVATVVTVGGFLRRADAAQKARWLPSLIEGALQGAFAVDEYEQVHDLAQTAMRARADGDGFVLDGVKACVLNGDRADLLVVLARTAGEPGDREGLSLFLVDAASAGISRRGHRTVDGQRAAEIGFAGVRVGRDSLLGEAGQAHDLAAQVIAETILALGAEAVGALSVLIDTTVEYAKTRKQFGVAIGNFQALQHRMADMFMAGEQTRSLLLAATLKVLEGHADAALAVHALKVQIGTGGRRIAQEAIQLHGGMGMTDELSVGHYAKRLTAIDALFGNSDRHLLAYARAS